jgi:DNA repair protein RadA/Sms
VVLIAGDPGIGKSTLVLQALFGLTRRGKVLYVSGEESPEQIKLRADRLKVVDSGIIVLPETFLTEIIQSAEKLRPELLVVDSIQTIYSDNLASAPGTVSQIRECATKLMFFAKKTAIPVFIIGHVTKEGTVAGPRVLEHIVDTVLYFEGEKAAAFRILRAVKNRFGSTNEIGVFEMADQGLKEVKNPSEIFLSEMTEALSGSVVAASIEGTRPILVELQALVSPTVIGIPRRTALGVDSNRVSLLVAIIDRRLGLRIGAMDVYVNVVAGLKLDEPSVDLAIASALVSSFKNKTITPGTFVFGEIGLAGELRSVSHAEARLKEAERLGFKRGVLPIGNAQRVKQCPMKLHGVKHLEEATRILFA